MSVKIKEVDRFISIYKHPVISLSVCSDWIDEALQFDKHIAAQKQIAWLSGWYGARRLAKRAFATYFDLQTQFEEKHLDWDAEKPRTDFTLTNGKLECDVNLSCIPIKDWNPKLGRSFEAKIYKITKKLSRPLIHVFATWSCPNITLIGWLPNSPMNDMGKVEVKESDVKPIYEHPVLSNLDNKGMYI